MHRTALLPGALLLLACNAAPVPHDDTGAALHPPSPSAAELSAVSAPAADSIAIDLELPAEAQHGQSIPITVRVTNATNRPLDLYLRGREPTVDVRVRDAASRVVWERLRDEVIPAVVQIRTLAAGESFDVRLTWDQRTNEDDPVPPASYTVRVALLTEDEPLWSETRPITIRGS